MHTLLILSSLALSFVGCWFCLLILKQAHTSGGRRALQFTGLLVPAVLLGLVSVAMTHFITQECFMAAPPADVALAEILSAVGAAGIVLATALNLTRAFLLPIRLRSRTWEAPDWLQARVTFLVGVIGLRTAPAVEVCADGKPWALVAGIFRPHLVLSSGLVAILDGEELDAVLCHELLHIRSRDILWTVLAGVMRDLTWYVPATRRLYRQMLVEQEYACDDKVPGGSRRLALASALARVWQVQAGNRKTPYGALGLLSVERSSQIEHRVRRLLDNADAPAHAARRLPGALLSMTLLLSVFIPAQLGAILFSMHSMGCGMQDFFSLMSR